MWVVLGRVAVPVRRRKARRTVYKRVGENRGAFREMRGTMKTIGLIGGMSWESSEEYYRILNQDDHALGEAPVHHGAVHARETA